jgi:membrane-associated phospholipid phosphatase
MMGRSADDVAAEVASNPVEEADVALSVQAASHRRHPAIRALGFLGDVADQPPLLMLTAGVLAFGVATGRPRARAAGSRMLLSFGIATAMKAVVKRSVSRTRPHVLLDDGVYAVRADGPDEGPWHSFPSGHTAGAVAVARALARTVPDAALPAYAAAAAVAAVQLPTAHHYASDVLAGAAIGLAADALAERAVRLAPALFEPDPD